MPGLVEPEMRTYLKDCNTTATNFYLKVAAGNAVFPYGIVFKVAPGRDYTHNSAGLYESVMQVSVWGQTYQQAKTLANEVMRELEGWHTVDDDVQAVFLLSESDLYEDDKKIFHIAMRFIVWHTFD